MEMRMWGQSKILSGCICDWCESREKGGRWSPRLPTPIFSQTFQLSKVIEQSRLFSIDLPAIKSYWKEPPFELCILLGE